ncbi:hypothetical protein D3C78_851480 [compost metagenome]
MQGIFDGEVRNGLRQFREARHLGDGQPVQGDHVRLQNPRQQLHGQLEQALLQRQRRRRDFIRRPYVALRVTQDHRLEHLRLAGIAAVEGALGNAGGGRDGFDAGGAEAVVHEQPGSRVQHVIAQALRFFQRGASTAAPALYLSSHFDCPARNIGAHGGISIRSVPASGLAIRALIGDK